jgi:hypothetical protein
MLQKCLSERRKRGQAPAFADKVESQALSFPRTCTRRCRTCAAVGGGLEGRVAARGT